MLLQKRGLKHPGEEGSWEFTHLWHKLRPWPDSVEGIGLLKKEVCRRHAQQRQRRALDQHGQEQRYSLGSLLLG